MEFNIEPLVIPSKVFSFNYEEMMAWAKKEADRYKSIVCTEKDLSEMKKDRAEVNRKIKAMNDERIRRKKEWLKPCDEFEAKVNNITRQFKEVADLRGEQIAEVENRAKQEKKQKIAGYFFTGESPDWLTLPMIWDDKWLNASVSMKSIQEQIDARIEDINNDLAALSNLPEFAFEAIETYKTTLDLNKSIAEGHRLSEIQKHKAEQERIKAEQEKERAEQERLRREQEEQLTFTVDRIGEKLENPTLATKYQAKEEAIQSPDELPTYVCFKALLTVSQALELKEFFESKNIEFSRI